MTLVLESPVYFRIVDFHISHSQLLIRGEKAIEGNNLDIVFEGTEFLNCPTSFEGIKLFELSEEVSREKGVSILPFTRNFLIVTENREYYIQAGVLRLYRNSLSHFETSIDMTGRGQGDLLWMSR